MCRTCSKLNIIVQFYVVLKISTLDEDFYNENEY